MSLEQLIKTQKGQNNFLKGGIQYSIFKFQIVPGGFYRCNTLQVYDYKLQNKIVTITADCNFSFTS